MRTIWFMVFLSILSGHVSAEWLAIAYTESFASYVDPKSIQKEGYRVRMWDLTDFKIAQRIGNGLPYLSNKAQHEYDCDDAQARILVASMHSGNIGSGEVVDMIVTSGEWLPIPPSSVVEEKWKAACGIPKKFSEHSTSRRTAVVTMGRHSD